MVTDGETFHIKNWRERQYKSDTSTERVRKHRKRHGNVSETPRARSESEPESDSEPKKSPNGDSSDLQTDDLQLASDLYNETAQRCGLSKIQAMNSSRRTKLKARLKECGGIDGWRFALEKVEASPFLRGETTDWRANLDFMLRPSNFTKLMEGGYDKGRGASGGGLRPVDNSAAVEEAIRRSEERERTIDG